MKISTKYYYNYIRDPQFLIRKFNNVSWIAAIILNNITGISEVESSSDWLRGSVFKTFEELEAAAVGL
jgi:hypothetical protein